MKILHLTLKKKWFDMILSGEKKEEYREIKEYWNARLYGKNFNAVIFKNGYSKNSRSVCFEVVKITIKTGNPTWGAPEKERVWVISLGDRMYEVPNVPR